MNTYTSTTNISTDISTSFAFDKKLNTNAIFADISTITKFLSFDYHLNDDAIPSKVKYLLFSGGVVTIL